jgi:hypothetical protein
VYLEGVANGLTALVVGILVMSTSLLLFQYNGTRAITQQCATAMVHFTTLIPVLQIVAATNLPGKSASGRRILVVSPVSVLAPRVLERLEAARVGPVLVSH